MPTTNGLPPSCSSLPSQGTLHIPDLLDVLMQPIRRDKQYLEWDGEAFPVPDEMIIKSWDLPQGYTRENWADWEPENPFIAERHYDHDPLAPSDGYEQDELEGIFGRMAERKRAEEDHGYIVEGPLINPSSDLPLEKGISDPTTPRLIHSTTEIHIANTLLSPSGGKLVPRKLSVPKVSAKSRQPSETISFDSTAANHDRLVSSQGPSTQAEGPSAVDRIEEIAQASTNDQLEDAINEYIDLDPDSAELSDAVEDVSPGYSLSAPKVSRTSTINFIQEQPNSTSEDEPREDHKSQLDNELGSPTLAAKEISTPTKSLDHSDTHRTQIMQEVLLPALEIEKEAVTKPSKENVDSPTPSSTPSSPRSPHLVTPGTDTRASQGREEGIQVFKRPPQFSPTDESDMDIPQVVEPLIKANPTNIDHHIVQMHSTPPISPPSEPSPLSIYATDPSHSPRDSRSSSSSSVSPSSESNEDEAIFTSAPRVPPSSTDIHESSEDFIPADLTLESLQISEMPSLGMHSAGGVPLPATTDIHNIIDELPLSESDTLDNKAGTSISKDLKHGVGSLATSQETRKTTDTDTSSLDKDMSKDDKMEVLIFIAGQKMSDNLDGHDDGPILIDINYDSPVDDDQQEAPESFEKDHESSREEQEMIEAEVPESPMTITKMEKGDAEEEEGFDEDGEHESISESCDIELTSNTNVAGVIDDEMILDKRLAEATLIEGDQQPESTIPKPKGKPGRKPKMMPPPDPENTNSSDKRKYPRRATTAIPSLRGTGSAGYSKFKRGPGRPPTKQVNAQNENVLDPDAYEEKPSRAKTLTSSNPATMRKTSTLASRGRSKTTFSRTQSTQIAIIDGPKRGRVGKAKVSELESFMQDDEAVDEDIPAPTELESKPKRLASSSSSVQQPPIRRAAQNANAAFKTQDRGRDERPEIKPIPKRKRSLSPDHSESDLGRLSQRITSKKASKGETLKRWTLAEDACLLRCWDGKSVLSSTIISQACDALLDPAVGSMGRTHDAVKYRLRQMYKDPDFHKRAKAFNESKPSPSA